MRIRLMLALIGILLVHINLAAQTKPAQEEWRAAFDQAYALREGEVIQHVLPPYIPERLAFYKHAAPGQARAVPQGPAVMVVRWVNGVPRMGHASFGISGYTLRDVLRNVIVLKSHEFDGPRELLDLELPGDWSIRSGTSQEDLLKGLAKRLREITARELSFVRENATLSCVIVRGELKPPEDLPAGEMWRLELALDEIEFLRPFGGAGPLEHLLNMISSATGWPVFNESTEPPARQFLSWSGGRIAEDDELERVPREQLDVLLNGLSRQTGLMFEVEQRKVQQWKLVEKD